MKATLPSVLPYNYAVMEKRQAPAVPVEILVGLIVAFNAIVRLRLLDLPLERDEV